MKKLIDTLEVLTLKTYQLELDVYQRTYACVMSCCCLCHLHFQLRTHLLHRQSYALQDLWKPNDPETCAMLILVLQEFWNSRGIITITRKYLKTILVLISIWYGWKRNTLLHWEGFQTRLSKIPLLQLSSR